MPKYIWAGGAFRLVADGSDTAPDTFDFTDQFNIATGSVRTSNSVTPIGFDAPTTISVSGSTSTEYSIDGGTFVSTAGVFNPGQSVRLRHTAAGTPSTLTTSNINIGGTTADFQSTTASTGNAAAMAPITAVYDQRRRLLYA